MATRSYTKHASAAERQAARRRQTREAQRRRRARLRAAAAAESHADHQRRDAPADPVRDFQVYVEGKLIVPRGIRAGKHFQLLPWQLRFAALVFDEVSQTVLLSVARKNGKSSLIGSIVSAFLDPASPLYGGPGWRALAIGVNARVANGLSRIIMAIAGSSELPFRENKGNEPHIHSPGGARVDFLTAGRSVAHGGDVDLAVIDEAGLLMAARDKELWSTAQSSVSAAANGKTLILGTRRRGDLFASALDQMRRGVEGVAGLEFAPPDDPDIMDPDVWAAGNPSLGPVKSLDYMRRAAIAAADDPPLQSEFVANDLNGVAEADEETIVALTDWKGVEFPASDLPPREGGVFIGVDIGGSKSMTAASILWESGRMEHLAAFPARPKIEKRGRADGVGDLYARMVRRHELHLSGGQLVDLAEFFERLAERVADFEVLAVGADRYRQAEVAEAAGGTAFEGAPWVWRGTGASAKADGSYDVRAFQAGVYRGEFAVAGGSLLWPFAVASSRIRHDKGGNPAVDRSRSRARQDLISAAVIACGLRALQRAADAGDEGHAVLIVN